MERMSKEELNKRKRQKNYYLLVEKTTLYDHRNLKKKMGITNVQIICWVTSSPATHIFFSNCFTFKNCHFFQKQSCLFQKIPPEKNSHNFFCFLLTQLHLGNFTCKKWKTAQKNLPNIFLLKTHIQNIQNCFSFFLKWWWQK